MHAVFVAPFYTIKYILLNFILIKYQNTLQDLFNLLQIKSKLQLKTL